MKEYDFVGVIGKGKDPIDFDQLFSLVPPGSLPIAPVYPGAVEGIMDFDLPVEELDEELVCDMASKQVCLLTSTAPSIAMDEFVKRMKARTRSFPKLPEDSKDDLDLIFTLVDARKTSLGKKFFDKFYKAYKKNLKFVFSRLSEMFVLPVNTGEFFLPGFCRGNEFVTEMNNLAPSLFGILDFGFADVIARNDLSQSTWLSAIELVMHLEEKDLWAKSWEPGCLDEEKIDAFLDEHWKRIFVFAVFIHNIHIFSNDSVLKKMYEDRYDRNRDSDERKMLRNQLQDRTGELNTANRKIAELKAENSNLRKHLNQTPQKAKNVSHIAEQYQQRLQDKDKTILSMQERLEQLEKEKAALERRISILEATPNAEEPWLTVELPESGVVFVGGHINMVKKIREIHPKWKYIDEGSLLSYPDKAEYIFVWSGHMSHMQFERLTEAYKGRIMLKYVTSTNIEKLENEMKKHMWEDSNSKGI